MTQAPSQINPANVLATLPPVGMIGKANYADHGTVIGMIADRVLESRGLGSQPNFQDSTVRGGYAR